MTLTELAGPTMPSVALAAAVSTDGIATVVTLRGEADCFTLPVVVDVLTRVIADYQGPVIVDLSPTEFVDGGTVRALGRAGRYLNDRGRTLTLRSPSAMAVRIVSLLGLSHLIERAPDDGRMTPYRSEEDR
jgi:anti-anti-sigma factor